MQKFWAVLILIVFLLPINKIIAQTSNAGFVPGNIWYSTDPFEEGDKIKIYTLIFNPDARELSGTVIFFDNSVFLGKKDFTAGTKGIKDVSIDWTTTAGSHSIFGKIENAKFLISKDKYEEVYLAENETSKSSRTVSKKIVAKKTEANSNSANIISGVESIKNIGNTLVDKIPDAVVKPVSLSASTVEKIRSSAGTITKDKKNEIQNEINTLNKASVKNESKFLKPFKYAELFFFTTLSFILNNKFIFYGISVFILGLILRYIWNLIF